MNFETSSEPFDAPVLRQARLRQGAIGRYPWARQNTWMPASAMAADALRHAPPPAAAGHERLLPNDAFEFRGGRPEASVRDRARTRWTDQAEAIRRRRF
jgi:hypothetical protein